MIAEEELKRLPAEWKGAALAPYKPTGDDLTFLQVACGVELVQSSLAYVFGTVARIIFVIDERGDAHVLAVSTINPLTRKVINEGQRVLTRRDAAYTWLLDCFTSDVDCAGLDVNVSRARLEVTRSRLQAFERTGVVASSAKPQMPFWERLNEPPG